MRNFVYYYCFKHICYAFQKEHASKVVELAEFVVNLIVIMTEENIKRNKPPAFEQLFNRDLFLLKLMGLSSMNGILSNHKPIKKWWDGIPIFISIIIMTTIVICEFQTMCQIFQQQLAYAIQLFSVICSGALSISKVKLLNQVTLLNIIIHFFYLNMNFISLRDSGCIEWNCTSYCKKFESCGSQHNLAVL